MGTFSQRFRDNIACKRVGTQVANRQGFRGFDFELSHPSNLKTYSSDSHFPIGRGLGDRSFRWVVSDYSNNYFRGDRNLIEKGSFSSIDVSISSPRNLSNICRRLDLNTGTYDSRSLNSWSKYELLIFRKNHLVSVKRQHLKLFFFFSVVHSIY